MTISKVSEKFSLENTNKSWIFYAIISAICYGLLSFFQYIILQKDSNINPISLAVFIALTQTIIGIILYFVFKISKMKKFEVSMFKNYRKDIIKLTQKKNIPITTIGSICDISGLVSLLISYISSPNPGLSDAISDIYLIPQAIITFFIFKTNINSLQILGMVLAVFGILLLST